jgi:metal-responsive CopG/Arc/MetJ family transcriptional regulator
VIEKRLTRTTVTLPAEVLSAVDEAVAGGEARNRSEFLERALRVELWRLKNEAIDASIRRMAHDPEFLEEHERIMKEFETADRETWSLISE